MRNDMSPYARRIWNRLVRAFCLRIESETPQMRVLARETIIEASGGSKRRKDLIDRWVLVYHRKEGYLDFQNQTIKRTYAVGSPTRKDTILEIDDHFTVNNAGTIRRIYKHNGTRVYAVRTVSLQNFYMLPDREAARLVMMTSPSLDWIRDLPVNYHPISNSQLSAMTSMDDFIAHFAGKETVVPKRLRMVFSPGALMILVQLVPGAYLNALSNILKQDFAPTDKPPTVKQLILAYYRKRIEDADNYLFHVVYSYVNPCRYLGEKVNMLLRSSQRIQSERERAWRGRNLKRIPEIHTKRELVIRSGKFGAISINLINSRKALFQESEMMKNCVDDYASDINAGECSIYHVEYQRAGYTLELQRDKRGRLIVAQIKGFANKEAPNRLKIGLQRILDEHNKQRATAPLPH